MAANVGSKEVDVNLTPLLDLVLQLIMFFMITVNFVKYEQFAPGVELPLVQNAVPLAESSEEPIILNIDSDGNLAGTRKDMDLDKGAEALKVHLMGERMEKERIARTQGRRDVKVVIVLRVDENCPYGKIWQYIDTCQRAGFPRWQLRVKKKG